MLNIDISNIQKFKVRCLSGIKFRLKHISDSSLLKANEICKSSLAVL